MYLNDKIHNVIFNQILVCDLILRFLLDFFVVDPSPRPSYLAEKYVSTCNTTVVPPTLTVNIRFLIMPQHYHFFINYSFSE